MGTMNTGWTPTHAQCDPVQGQVPKYNEKGQLCTTTPADDEVNNNASANIEYVKRVVGGHVNNKTMHVTVDEKALYANKYTKQEVDSKLQDVVSNATSLEYSFVGLAIEVETLKNAELNGMADNVFIETFMNIDDITLEKGDYNSSAKKIVA